MTLDVRPLGRTRLAVTATGLGTHGHRPGIQRNRCATRTAPSAERQITRMVSSPAIVPATSAICDRSMATANP